DLESCAGDVQDGEVGDDTANYTAAGRRQVARGDQLGLSRRGDVVGEYDDAAGATDQIHRAAHAFDHRAGHHPVGQITSHANLHSAKHSDVDVAAADHGEAGHGVEVRGSPHHRDGLFSRVDQVGVDVVVEGEWTNSQHAV